MRRKTSRRRPYDGFSFAVQAANRLHTESQPIYVAAVGPETEKVPIGLPLPLISYHLWLV